MTACHVFQLQLSCLGEPKACCHPPGRQRRRQILVAGGGDMEVVTFAKAQTQEPFETKH